MRRPRIGPRIADSLLYASSVLREAVTETLEEGAGEGVAAQCKELDTASTYIRQLATWYREREGIE